MLAEGLRSRRRVVLDQREVVRTGFWESVLVLSCLRRSSRYPIITSVCSLPVTRLRDVQGPCAGGNFSPVSLARSANVKLLEVDNDW